MTAITMTTTCGTTTKLFITTGGKMRVIGIIGIFAAARTENGGNILNGATITTTTVTVTVIMTDTKPLSEPDITVEAGQLDRANQSVGL